jgi:hypothetical protein
VPGAGGVDDGVGSYALRALPILISNLERRGLPAFRLELVEADAADVRDAAGSADVACGNGFGGERLQLALK